MWEQPPWSVRSSAARLAPSPALHGIIEGMRNRRLTFALFAAAILFSMVREWSAPVFCARSILVSSNVAQSKR